jgi:predicted RNA binding protein YcfA (HicA-like mRNA interferase family)
MKPRRLLARLTTGDLRNVRFDDFARLLEALGFEQRRTRGSHQVFVHPDLGEILVVRPTRGGDAKPYQLRQLLRLIEQYALGLED